MDDPGPETLGDEMRIFVDRVRLEAALERDVDAEVLARATVRALGEQVGAEAAGHLTASLPEELVAEITARATESAAEFDRDGFLDTVAAEIPDDLDREQVERRVHAVLAVVREFSPDGQLEGTLAGLPRSLAAMFA